MLNYSLMRFLLAEFSSSTFWFSQEDRRSEVPNWNSVVCCVLGLIKQVMYGDDLSYSRLALLAWFSTSRALRVLRQAKTCTCRKKSSRTYAKDLYQFYYNDQINQLQRIDRIQNQRSPEFPIKVLSNLFFDLQFAIENGKVGIGVGLIIKLDIKMKKNAQYNSNANMDRSNRSVISKSSRLTKKNPEIEPEEPNFIYFQKNSIGDKVLERTNCSRSKQKHEHHLDKVGRIIQDLMNRHKRAKQKLQKLKQESEKEHDRECPFAPKKSPIQRYQIGGDIIRRNQIWMREKKRKQLQLKQTVTLENLKQCTFSPKFSSKKASESYLKHKDMDRTISPKATFSKNSNSFSPFRTTKRQFTETQYQMAKRNLISKMMTALQ